MKSDDTSGRVKSYEAIVKGENIPAPEVPESFKVLVKEMKSLCLNIELEGHRPADADDESAEEDADQALYEALAADARETEEEETSSAIDDIAAGVDELISSFANDSANDLIGEGEEA